MGGEHEETYRTTDIGLAAYLKIHGLKVKDYERGAFVFADPDLKAGRLVIDFANSPEARFDHEVRSLKKLWHR